MSSPQKDRLDELNAKSELTANEKTEKGLLEDYLASQKVKASKSSKKSSKKNK